MKVSVYVEGPSDKAGLEVLLEPIIRAGNQKGVGIRFFELQGKAPILDKVPRMAAEILKQQPEDWVFALPDLYPMSSFDDGPHKHRSFKDLERLLRGRFDARADNLGLSDAVRTRVRIHCLKHDLEALLLAAPEQLRQRLRTKDALRDWWCKPVEDQNDSKPPKRVVEALFKKYRKNSKYVDTSDVPAILKGADLEMLERECPQHFAPFTRELRDIVSGVSLTKPGGISQP